MNIHRRSAYIIIFGALWGGAEMFLGGALHAMNIPMKGMIMSTVGAFLAVSARLWVGRRGTILAVGAIAALLKLFSIGGLVLSPAIAILLESLLGEAAMFLLGGNLAGAATAGAAMVVYTIIHRAFSLLVVYRAEIQEFYQGMFAGSGLEAAVREWWWLLLAAYAAVHIAVGGISGLLAYISVRKAKAARRGK